MGLRATSQLLKTETIWKHSNISKKNSLLYLLLTKFQASVLFHRIWGEANLAASRSIVWAVTSRESHATFLDSEPLCAHFVPHYLTECCGDDWNVFSWLLKGRPPRCCLTFGRERAAFHIWIIHHLFDPPLKCHHNNGSELASVSFFLPPCGGKVLTILISSAVKILRASESKFIFSIRSFMTYLLFFLFEWRISQRKKKTAFSNCTSAAFYSLNQTLISSHLLVKLFDALYLNSYPVRPCLVCAMAVARWWQSEGNIRWVRSTWSSHPNTSQYDKLRS